MNLNQTLKSLRLEHHILLKEIAAYLNVSIGTISNYETGVHRPDPDTLCRLADFYGVTTDYLLGRTTYKYDIVTLNRILDDYMAADYLKFMQSLEPAERHIVISFLKLLTR